MNIERARKRIKDLINTVKILESRETYHDLFVDLELDLIEIWNDLYVPEKPLVQKELV